MNQSFIFNRCLCAVVVMLGFTCNSSAQEMEDVRHAHFVGELDRLVPKGAGAIIVTYEAEGARAGITTAGYDSASGAWFVASQTGCGGRDLSGNLYQANVEDTELSVMQPYFAELVSIANDIPRCYLIAMRAQPEMIVDAELGPDGVWRVLYHAVDPANINDRAPWELRIDDKTGHVLSKRWTVSEDSPITEYDWEGTTVGRRVQPEPMNRVRTFVDDQADLAEFEPEKVFQRAISYRIQADQKLNAMSSGYVQNDDGEWVQDKQTQSTQPFNDPLTRTYRTPLIIAGVLVFLIAIAQLIRKGRTQ